MQSVSPPERSHPQAETFVTPVVVQKPKSAGEPLVVVLPPLLLEALLLPELPLLPLLLPVPVSLLLEHATIDTKKTEPTAKYLIMNPPQNPLHAPQKHFPPQPARLHSRSVEHFTDRH